MQVILGVSFLFFRILDLNLVDCLHDEFLDLVDRELFLLDQVDWTADELLSVLLELWDTDVAENFVLQKVLGVWPLLGVESKALPNEINHLLWGTAELGLQGNVLQALGEVLHSRKLVDLVIVVEV